MGPHATLQTETATGTHQANQANQLEQNSLQSGDAEASWSVVGKHRKKKQRCAFGWSTTERAAPADTRNVLADITEDTVASDDDDMCISETAGLKDSGHRLHGSKSNSPKAVLKREGSLAKRREQREQQQANRR